MSRPSSMIAMATAALLLPAALRAQSITPEPSGAGTTADVHEPLVPSVNAGDDAILVEVPTDPDAVDTTPVLVRPAKPLEPGFSDANEGADEPVAFDPSAAGETERGLVVRVEKISTGDHAVAARDVKLYAPFPPKPLSAIPDGWLLRRPGDVTPFNREVDLGGGNKITLSILPFVLAPDDGPGDVFNIREPGYKPALQYRQLDTVGALLTEYTEQLAESDLRMSEAIERLNQLLLSFPEELE